MEVKKKEERRKKKRTQFEPLPSSYTIDRCTEYMRSRQPNLTPKRHTTTFTKGEVVVFK